ncbi:MAG: nuclear transport factor 2 family protein [Dehalococcoidia bacterium]|nr:nuclear transport factor 2 family protein [Dehalococcoidia bacterium]
MTDNSPKAIVLRMLDQAMLDMLHGTAEFLDSFADSAVWEYAPTAGAPQWRRLQGKEARRAAYHRVYDQATDTTMTIHEVVAEGGSVAVAYAFGVTFATDWPGLPAGARAVFECVNLFAVSDGLIVSEKQYTGPMLAEGG